MTWIVALAYGPLFGWWRVPTSLTKRKLPQGYNKKYSEAYKNL
jgi:hypothetical protein